MWFSIQIHMTWSYIGGAATPAHGTGAAGAVVVTEVLVASAAPVARAGEGAGAAIESVTATALGPRRGEDDEHPAATAAAATRSRAPRLPR